MSRSVSAPSSVTKTSPCWNGLIVPGSTFRYGSNFCTWTWSPRALRRRPSEAAVMPLPRDETTPPVTNTYFVFGRLTGEIPCLGSRETSVAAPGDGSRNRTGAPRRSKLVHRLAERVEPGDRLLREVARALDDEPPERR